MNYFYDKQIRRYLLQFVRLFSNFSVQIGTGPAGDPIYRTVPVKYGDPSRMAAAIMRENSENKMLSVPMMSVYITGLRMAPERRMSPTYTETRAVYEKNFNESTGEYTNEPGNAYSITRHIPVPYNLDVNVDIWTSNTDQKLQLFEQLLVLFNPTVDLNTSNNPFDWTALTYNELTNINFSSRSQPVGTEDIIDIGTLTFSTQINLTPPAKFNRNKIIHTIINKLYTVSEDQVDDFAAGNSFTYDDLSYVVVTPSQYYIQVTGNEVQLLNRSFGTTDENGVTLDWEKVLIPYGELNPGYSQLRLRLAGTPDDNDDDVIGTIDFHNSDSTKLILTLDDDTLPAATLTAVDDVVNPQTSYPGDGTLPAAASGQRYIVTSAVPSGANWGTISADAGDIIAYDGTDWTVSFDASAASGDPYVTDNDTDTLLYWDGSDWVNAYQQRYKPGFWRLFI